MTIAELHGKSPLTTSEDMLTANVFTAFRYLPADRGIIVFLRSVKGLGDVIPEPEREATADYFFWPLGQTREPDLLLELTINGAVYHVVVEAKYLSGASDREIEEVEEEEETILLGNQLADQLRDLMHGVYTIRQDGRRDRVKVLASRPENRHLLYLTAHALRPGADLARSAALYAQGAVHIFWESWYQVHDYLENNRPSFQAFPYDRVVDDVLQLLALKGFSSFAGVRRPEALKSNHLLQGKFWLGRDEPLPSFQGIGPPPPIAIPRSGGHFWANG